jgi:hypothetical protein
MKICRRMKTTDMTRLNTRRKSVPTARDRERTYRNYYKVKLSVFTLTFPVDLFRVYDKGTQPYQMLLTMNEIMEVFTDDWVSTQNMQIWCW